MWRKNDGIFKREDGKYLIPDNLRQCDPGLANVMMNIACSDNRGIEASEEQCFQDICENLSKHTGIPEDRILKITFPKCSVRDYLAVSFSTNHAKKIERAFLEMEQGIRGKLGVCRIPK